MNPIAFIAFLVGINSTAPNTPVSTAEQVPALEKPQSKPSKETGTPKGACGGWDHN